MSNCSFSIPFTQSPADVIEKAKNAITGAGGTFNGDVNQGSFRLSTPLGKVEGTYIINNQSLDVTVTDKPLFIGCGKIESELRKRLGS